MGSKQIGTPAAIAVIVLIAVVALGFGYAYMNKSSGGSGSDTVKKSGLPPGMRGKADQLPPGSPVPSTPSDAGK